MGHGVLCLPLGPGDRVLTNHAEYGSNMIAYLHRARQTGAEVAVIPADDTGTLDLDALTGMIDDRVKLISISHVPTGGGLVNPAAEVGAIARAHRIPYLLDACQSAGQMPLDVAAIGCDFLSATGRKYPRPRHGPATWPGGGSNGWTRRCSTSTPPSSSPRPNMWSVTTPGGSGSGSVFSPARRPSAWPSITRWMDLSAIWVRHLADRLRAGLADLPHVTVTDRAASCGLVTLPTADNRPTPLRPPPPSRLQRLGVERFQLLIVRAAGCRR